MNQPAPVVILPINTTDIAEHADHILFAMVEGMLSGDESCVFIAIDEIVSDYEHDSDAARQVYDYYEKTIIEKWHDVRMAVIHPDFKNMWYRLYPSHIRSLGNDTAVFFDPEHPIDE